MKRIAVLALTAMLATSIVACGEVTESEVPTVGISVEPLTESKTEFTEVSEISDEDKAQEVANLIDAIYVQERTSETDELCAEAKEKWDALTDAQKELVKGEEADPDYFGRDTGDASKDDPLNSDDIGKNEILVVSFGTSFNDSRAEDIGGIEKAIISANKHWSVRRAFTAQIIINHVQARDNEFIDNVDQALERSINNGVKNLVIQPTHLMHGAEYDELIEILSKYEDKFESVKISEPLLGEVGSDATVINDDKKVVAEAVINAAVKSAGYDKINDMEQDNTALVLMGHGTAHTAKVTYSQMQTQMNTLGYSNVFIGTVEGEPEETSCENIIKSVSDAGYTKVILRPLMVVAGDHANNDMADPEDEESWYSQFTASGKFEFVTCQIEGLGRIPEVQSLYVKHLEDAMSDIPDQTARYIDPTTFNATFTTDSSMFHIAEPYNNSCYLYSVDGKDYVHISLSSENIVNLYYGTAEDAQKEGAVLIQPTKDIVKFADGTDEVVNGFDIPVPYFNKEFDVALVGTKGKWYDHKVVVTKG